MSVNHGAMSVEMQIDELVLHGFASADRRVIGMAFQQELTRLLHDQGVPKSLAVGGSVDRLDAGAVTIAPGMSAESIGVQVAQAVYGGLSR